MAQPPVAVAQAARRFAYIPLARFAASSLFGLAVFAALPDAYSRILRAIVGWDAGTVLLIAWVMVVVAFSTTDHMRRRAALQDPGRTVLLVVIVAGAMFSISALTVIQKAMKTDQSSAAALYLPTIIATIVLSWFLLHVVFALHYAHRYYGPAADEADEDGLVGGLEFPGEPKPDYWDFLYFSFVVGMTCQVSDVQVSGRLLRRMTLAHGIVSFFFNTIILALTINILAGII
jgi:uncharacterized membrane protein